MILLRHAHAAEQFKTVADVAAGGVTLGVVLGYFPALAAAATFLYTVIRICETETVRRWWKRMRGR